MSSVRLSWRDNSANEDGFRIERRLSGVGDFAQIAEAGVNATSYQDGSVADGSSYEYRVRAFNAVGNSAYSNVAAVGPINIALPQLSSRGPQASIVPVGGAILIPAGSTAASRQALINAALTGQAFALEVGSHTADGSNTPKSGQSFVGQYGAVIDGSGWSTGDAEAAFLKSLDGGIVGVTIRNLRITAVPKLCVNSFLSSSDWLVDYCELDNGTTGVGLGFGGKVKNSHIHHHSSGGYAFQNCTGAVFTNNEVDNNGTEQKFLENPLQSGTNTGLSIANNYFHDNSADGFWIDGNGSGSIIENNVVENNGRTGITLESAVSVTVRNNTVRNQAAGEGVLLTVSRSCSVTGNTLEDNLYGVGLFLDCDSLSPQFPWAQDLANNAITYNSIRVPNVGGAYGALLTFLFPSTCKAPYVSNSKLNNFNFNSYRVPSSGNFWGWDGSKSWTDWLALGHDADGGRFVAA